MYIIIEKSMFSNFAFNKKAAWFTKLLIRTRPISCVLFKQIIHRNNPDKITVILITFEPVRCYQGTVDCCSLWNHLPKRIPPSH